MDLLAERINKNWLIKSIKLDDSKSTYLHNSSHFKIVDSSGWQKKGNGIPHCRGNASKAKEGQGSLVFQSFHPTLLNDHYHDNIEHYSPHFYDHLDQLLGMIFVPFIVKFLCQARLLGKLLFDSLIFFMDLAKPIFRNRLRFFLKYADACIIAR